MPTKVAMADIAGLLKSEITRLSKKVMREEVGPLQGLVRAQKKQIANLRKQVDSLEREIKRQSRSRPAAVAIGAEADAEGGSKLRFRHQGMVTLRKRLELSAADFGTLIGVSGATIYNWERKVTSPSGKQLVALAAIRGIGKREALQRIGGGEVAAE